MTFSQNASQIWTKIGLCPRVGHRYLADFVANVAPTRQQSGRRRSSNDGLRRKLRADCRAGLDRRRYGRVSPLKWRLQRLNRCQPRSRARLSESMANSPGSSLSHHRKSITSSRLARRKA